METRRFIAELPKHELQRVTLEADVGGLLVDVRTAATQSNNSDGCPLDYFLTVFTQERLPLITWIHKNSTLPETTLMHLSSISRF